jgi:hypothetical protein
MSGHMNGARPVRAKRCKHDHFRFQVKVVHLSDSNVKYLEIHGDCVQCGALASFQGLPLGVSPFHPTGSIDGREAMVPFLAAGEEPSGALVGSSVSLHMPKKAET